MTLSTLLAIFLGLLFLVIIMNIVRTSYYTDDYYDDREIITTTTTTVVDEDPIYNIVGTLGRQTEGSQYYVIDPVDGEKIWVNSSDDLYRDAADKIWKLV